ncbi:MAG: amidohydrolase family protein [Gemmatimonadales bacterium]|nr:amidohydrolase family protein [Candidatus Palauibacter irciniicola]MYC19127.1 amidohydrolase family protein [Gemmatimonadales bacterium]
MSRVLAAFAAIATVLADPVAAQTYDRLSEEARAYVAVRAPTVALEHVRVIDGTGGPVLEDQTVLLRDGRIAAVGPAASIDVPEGADRHDLRGHTVIPGMVGMHDHLFYTAVGGRRVQLGYSAPRLYLGSGVTTIRTTGSVTPYADVHLKDAIDRGDSPGPRIHLTAPYITGSTGAPHQARVTSPEQARRFVEYWAGEGATWVKAYTSIGSAELAAAIEEAHRLGLRVTGHLCSVSFQEAVALGIDNLEHGMLTASDFVPEKEPDLCPGNIMQRAGSSDPTGPIARETIEAMVEAGVGLTATLSVYEAFFPDRDVVDERTLELMAPDLREAYLDERGRIQEMGPDPESFRNEMRFEKAFVDAGGLLASGVDPTGNGGALPGFGNQRNFELLLEAGLTPVQAVQVVSANGAKILGVDDELGTVEAGKLADLIVLNGDPGSDPRAIRAVRWVFKDGVGYDSGDLIQATRGLVGVR